MTMIRCPACVNSDTLCSTCDGKGFISDEGQYDAADFTETDEDFQRVRQDQADGRKRDRLVARRLASKRGPRRRAA